NNGPYVLIIFAYHNFDIIFIFIYLDYFNNLLKCGVWIICAHNLEIDVWLLLGFIVIFYVGRDEFLASGTYVTFSVIIHKVKLFFHANATVKHRHNLISSLKDDNGNMALSHTDKESLVTIGLSHSLTQAFDKLEHVAIMESSPHFQHTT
ncbi:hypothetical protein ACJX0J_027772, partial [Zea mays]